MCSSKMCPGGRLLIFLFCQRSQGLKVAKCKDAIVDYLYMDRVWLKTRSIKNISSNNNLYESIEVYSDTLSQTFGGALSHIDNGYLM